MDARYAADAIAVVAVGRRRLYCCSHACRRIARARAAVVGVRVVAGFRRRPSALATRAFHGYLWFVGLKNCGVAAVAVGQDANLRNSTAGRTRDTGGLATTADWLLFVEWMAFRRSADRWGRKDVKWLRRAKVVVTSKVHRWWKGGGEGKKKEENAKASLTVGFLGSPATSLVGACAWAETGRRLLKPTQVV
jgi:hypothetical protein